MNRPLLTRDARERCPHQKSVAIRSDLPDSYDGRQWCVACGVFFEDGFIVTNEPGENAQITNIIDWPATEAADRADIEAMGQGVLDLD